MTKPSTITDAIRNADEDSATQTFASSAGPVVTRSGRHGARRGMVHTTVSMLTLATALTAIVGFSGGAAAASTSAGAKSKASTSKSDSRVKTPSLAKRRAAAVTAAGRRHRPRPTPVVTPKPVLTPAPVVTPKPVLTPAPVVTRPPAPVVTTPPAPPIPAPPIPAPAVTLPPAPVVTPPVPAPSATTPPVAVGTPKAPPRSGVPVGMVLRTMVGMTITTAGTVIDGADIQGGVTIAAENVVIRRSRISGVGMAGVHVKSGSLIIEDTTIIGFDNSLGGGNYTATRVEVTGSFSDGFKIGDNVIIQDSWCHDMTPAEGAHADCGQIQSGVKNVIVRRNWFDIDNQGANAALFLAPDLGPSSPGPLLVENNVLGGGNFALQCVDGDFGQYFIAGITIRNNEFLRDSTYGAMRVNVPATLSGNVYMDTKQPV